MFLEVEGKLLVKGVGNDRVAKLAAGDARRVAYTDFLSLGKLEGGGDIPVLTIGDRDR